MTRERIPVLTRPMDPWDWVEMAYDKGWTDGGAVVAPTEKKVAAVLDYLGKPKSTNMGPIPPMDGEATLEQLAINCVMAGCKPEYVPVVLAALSAMLEPQFNLRGLLASTDDYWPLVIVSGPAVKELGFASGYSVFAGGGSRANATVGRAIRLILWNIGGYVLGETIKATLGHQGQFSYCIAENQDYNPWKPLHVDYGVPESQSAVTVLACDAPHDALGSGGGMGGSNPRGSRILNMISDVMCQPGQPQMLRGGQVLVAIVPAAAVVFRTEGWTKDAVKLYLFEHARVPLKELKRSVYPPTGVEVKWPQWVNPSDEHALVPMVHTPDDLVVMVTGAYGQWWNSVCHGWGDKGGFAMSKAIEFPQ